MTTLWGKGNEQYPIWIEAGSLTISGHKLAEILPAGKVLLVSDTQVFSLYGERAEKSLTEAGFSVKHLILSAGENTKTWKSAETIFAAALEAGMEREGSVFVALGGGVIGDLTGFAAASYLRGIPFIQYPTSLLAQVDSSIGGKVAINIPQGKNLVGFFYDPLAVVLDTDVLSTLPYRDLVSGLGEIIKYSIIGDQDLFYFLEDELSDILQGNMSFWERIITRCLQVKAEIVAADARERNLRRILNFGHTLGHALEREAGYGYYRHGEAVALGMQMVVSVALEAHLLPQKTADRMQALISLLPLPSMPEHITANKLMTAVTLDKKRRLGQTVWVLPSDIGVVTCHQDIPDELVHRVVEEYCHYK